MRVTKQDKWLNEDKIFKTFREEAKKLLIQAYKGEQEIWEALLKHQQFNNLTPDLIQLKHIYNYVAIKNNFPDWLALKNQLKQLSPHIEKPLVSMEKIKF